MGLTIPSGDTALYQFNSGSLNYVLVGSYNVGTPSGATIAVDGLNVVVSNTNLIITAPNTTPPPVRTQYVIAWNAGGTYFSTNTSSTQLDILSASSSPTLTGVSLSPTSLSSASSSTITVTLSAVAPTGGISVAVTTPSTSGTVPGYSTATSILVPAGSTTGTGAISLTTAPTGTGTMTVTGTYSGVSQSAVLSVSAAGGAHRPQRRVCQFPSLPTISRLVARLCYPGQLLGRLLRQ